MKDNCDAGALVSTHLPHHAHAFVDLHRSRNIVGCSDDADNGKHDCWWKDIVRGDDSLLSLSPSLHRNYSC